jgi:hypothetical protein
MSQFDWSYIPHYFQKKIYDLCVFPFEYLDESYRKMSDRMKNLKGAYAGKRCFIMGNGPSLNKMDLNLFQNEYVWGSNRCYLLFDRINWRPSFFTAVDTRVVPDNAGEINRLVKKLPETLFFFPSQYWHNHTIHSSRNLFWFKEIPKKENLIPQDHFSLDPSTCVYTVQTVTITALQLAVYLGFNPIYLIGCDTSYTIPPNAIFENGKTDLLVSKENNDPNHFSSDYFGTGKKWHDPHVDRMISHYQDSLELCNSVNVSVYNATVGGQLEVFPRVNYLELF